MEQKNAPLWSRDFILCIAINFFIFLNHIMILSTFPLFLEWNLGLSEAVAGSAALAFSLVAVLLRPVIGWLLDCGRRKVLLVLGCSGLLLVGVGYTASALLAAAGYSLLLASALALVCRTLNGAALAFSNTSSATIISDTLPRSRFAEGMGYFGMSTALATSVAPALGLALLDAGAVPLFAAAVGVMVLSLVLCAVLRTRRLPPARPPFRLRGLIEGNAVPASAVCLVFLLTWGALENFLPDFAIKYDLPGGGVFFAITAVMLVLVRLFLGRLADRMGEGIFVYTCNGAMFAAFLLLALAPGRWAFYLAAVLAGYAFGGIEPALQTMAIHIVPPERRGAANSTFLCAYDIGLGGGGFLAGHLITGLGYHTMFLVVSLAALASVLLYLLWGRRHPSAFRQAGKHT